MRSNEIKKGLERSAHRALLYASGVALSQMDRSFIGIASMQACATELLWEEMRDVVRQ